MNSLQVDFMPSNTHVTDIRRYTDIDLNKCFKMILNDMVSCGFKRARIHLNKCGRWVLVGTYSQDDIRGLIDDDLCG